MNSVLLLLVCIAILACGYVFYGGWLCKQWGVGESKEETPAHTLEDGVDYVPAKAPVLMGHHFSSIAGAGPITGPIGAAMFGYFPDFFQSNFPESTMIPPSVVPCPPINFVAE